MDEYQDGALPHTYWVVENGQAEPVSGGVIDESLVSIYVNGAELATVMCSPLDQEALSLGFLFTEGVIDSMAEVGVVKANVAGTVVDILLTRSDYEQPRRMVLTSGCGGGVTFQQLSESQPALESDFVTTPEMILARMRDLNTAAQLYRAVRGVHTAILTDEDGMLLSAEDVGRHNTIDKIVGKALQAGIDTRDRILFTSGRISSEMLGKARRMGVPLIASRTAPTSIAVKLAEAWNICIVGYVRRDSLRVYTHPQRLGLPEVEALETISGE